MGIQLSMQCCNLISKVMITSHTYISIVTLNHQPVGLMVHNHVCDSQNANSMNLNNTITNATSLKYHFNIIILVTSLLPPALVVYSYISIITTCRAVAFCYFSR